jgi:hypothetical protein
VDPVSCLKGCEASSPRGQRTRNPSILSSWPLRLQASHPTIPGAGQRDLLALDPINFEDLVAALFKAMRMEVMTTGRSGDGGVDVRAMNPDPIRGRKLVT